jgi:hypothetical protein
MGSMQDPLSKTDGALISLAQIGVSSEVSDRVHSFRSQFPVERESDAAICT